MSRNVITIPHLKSKLILRERNFIKELDFPSKLLEGKMRKILEPHVCDKMKLHLKLNVIIIVVGP